MILVKNLRFPAGRYYSLEKQIAKKLNLDLGSFELKRILRKALDTRKHALPFYDFTVLIEPHIELKPHPDVIDFAPPPPLPRPSKAVANPHPFIIGMGPAGLFCALAMVENGFQPYLFDRGDALEQRAQKVDNYWRHGILDEESNVQFGEGGAGAFSDGKLTSRSKDPVVDRVFEYLIAFGADSDISYEALPHLGTDGIRSITTRIRSFLISKGCKFFYLHKLNAIDISGGLVSSVHINQESYQPELLILALGNSARQTFKMLSKHSIAMEPKDFAIGLRIEHSQSYINKTIYGNEKWSSILGSATYRLVDRKSSSYTFCMCPGGSIIAAASENDSIVTNGMSFSGRNSGYANSAIVTAINKTIYGNGVLAGIDFQHQIEKQAYNKGYYAPVQTAKDYLSGNLSTRLPACSYLPGTYNGDISTIFPASLSKSLKIALQKYDSVLSGFVREGTICAPETRTSSPIRILRDSGKLSSLSAKNLYPIGEGAGYAGGIISSAADGYRTGMQFHMGCKRLSKVRYGKDFGN
ncbi:MAG: hypothetical protein PHI68_02710 [Candidatus Cloacimonetes bacterium]|nr:hypothetical protein [Candidatus Cloacimonadota bacterium]